MNTNTFDLTQISLRPITGSRKDMEFLYLLYASIREPEFAYGNWTPQQKEEFLKMQFHLQHTQWMEVYKGSQFDIIEYNHEPAGRLYVFRKQKDIRIVDIALLPEFRGKGIGSHYLGELMREADEKQKTLSLHVEQFNPAMNLYIRLGFIKGEEVGPYYYMERLPRSAQGVTG